MISIIALTPFTMFSLTNSASALFRRIVARRTFSTDQYEYTEFTKSGKSNLELALTDAKRFQSIEERDDSTVHTYDSIKRQCRARYFTMHRECLIIKSPEDMLIYQQLLQIVKPKTIVELGSLSGASALWLSDMSTLYGNKCNIFSYDIDLSYLDEKVKKMKPDNVTFLQGDTYKIEKMFDETFLLQMPRPLLLIEDCHHNTEGIMKFFHQYMKEGDYMIIEDTNKWLPASVGAHADDPSYQLWEFNKMEIVRAFLTEFKDHYSVDSFFTDLLGYNYTWNSNGFIRKMK